MLFFVTKQALSMAIMSAFEPPLCQSMPLQGAAPVPRLEALLPDVLIQVLRHIPLVGRIRTVSRLKQALHNVLAASTPYAAGWLLH